MTHPEYHRQQGAALIMVLLAMALISILAVNSSEKIRYNSARVSNQSDHSQAYWYALGAEAFARAILKKDIQAVTINLEQDWATSEAIFPIEGGALQGSITDLHRCFNVNALAEGSVEGNTLPPAHRQFNALMSALDLPDESAEKLRERIRDWTDPDATASGFQGMEYGYSTDSGISYQPPNAPVFDISELRLFTDLAADELNQVLPFLCSLPDDPTLAININTLGTEEAVLLVALLGDTLSLQEATELIEARPAAGFSSFDALWHMPQLKDKTIPEDGKATISLKSTYFRTDIQVHYQNIRRIYHAWFKINKDNLDTLARQYGERL
ncbi:MAG: type II secretion system minor pseudopilin GspK [Pontibacterium sp.]